MPSPTRIRGAKLMLKFGTPAVDYKCDTTSVVLDSEEDDVQTFCDAEEGGARRWFLQMSAVQSTDEASLWRYIWDHSGDEVPFTYAPHGNDVATTTQPHFIGTAKIGPKPTIGGQASVNGTFSFDTRWEVVGTPVLDDGTESGS